MSLFLVKIQIEMFKTMIWVSKRMQKPEYFRFQPKIDERLDQNEVLDSKICQNDDKMDFKRVDRQNTTENGFQMGNLQSNVKN